MYKFITVIQYLSLAYQAYHCSAMLLCSPVSVSLCLHLLAISDLLFFSTRAPQPSFTVLLSCCTHALRFLCFSLLCSVCHLHSMHHSSFCVSAVAHSSFYMPESLSTSATLISSLFSILIVSMHLVHALSLCFCMLSPCRVLCLIIIATLQLLWQLNPCIHHHWVLCRDSFASPVVETLRLLYSQSSSTSSLHSTGRFLETLQLLWQSH
jgi:hypothetical protein